MQDAIGFVEPAGQIVYEVGKIAAGLRGKIFSKGLAAKRILRRSAGRIDECGGIADFDAGGDGSNTHGDRQAHWDFGRDFDEIVPRGEALGGEYEMVDAEGQILDEVASVRADLKGTAELVGVADEFGDGS